MLQNGHDGLEYGGKLDTVEEYRKYRALWRSSDTNYKIREMRRNALQELREKYLMESKSILNQVRFYGLF
jgi:hypothetical protein